MRREFLKGYVYTLLAEGAIADGDLRNPLGILPKVLRAVGEDFEHVAGDLALRGAQQVVGQVVTAVGDAFAKYREVFERGGFRALWDEVNASYVRGLGSVARTKR